MRGKELAMTFCRTIFQKRDCINYMRKIFIISAAFIVFSVNCFAQQVSKADDSNNKSISKKAEKFDEFGKTGECETGARLDNFLVTLQNDPTLKGVIIAYRGTDGLPAEFNVPIARIYQNHLSFRNFDSSRVKVIDGGFRTKQTTELWIVPEGATLSNVKDTVSPPKTPKNKTYLYDLVYLEATGFTQATDDDWNSEISEELSDWKYYWASKNFAAKVKEQKGSRAIIIYYADDEYHDLNKINAHLADAKRRLAIDGKIAFERFDVVFGGFRGGIEFELWLVPKNGAFPTPTPEERPVEEADEDLESL